MLEISGTGPNVAMAGYVHEFVTRFIDRTWRLHRAACRRADKAPGDLRSYATGVVNGFRERLAVAEEKLADTPEEGEAIRALIRAGDPKLRVYFADHYPSVRTRTESRAVLASADAYETGRQYGRALNVRRPITKGAKRRTGPSRHLPS